MYLYYKAENNGLKTAYKDKSLAFSLHYFRWAILHSQLCVNVYFETITICITNHKTVLKSNKFRSPSFLVNFWTKSINDYQFVHYRLLDSLVVECWLRVLEVPGSIPSQGLRHTKDVIKMVPVIPLFSTQHWKGKILALSQ